MRVLVCGGRDYQNKDKVYQTLYNFCDKHNLWTKPDDLGNKLPGPITIIHGGAKGADTWADNWAIINWTGLKEFKANWKMYGKSAGFIRNTQMLEEGKPDIVIAFPGGKGTQMMIDIARKAGVEVLQIED